MVTKKDVEKAEAAWYAAADAVDAACDVYDEADEAEKAVWAEYQKLKEAFKKGNITT